MSRVSDVSREHGVFGQSSGFMAYAEEEIWYRPAETSPSARPGCAPGCLAGSVGGRYRRTSSTDDVPALQEVSPSDAWHLFDLWTHTTPPAIARIEGYGASDWEPVGHEAVVPRSSLNPLLHFSEVNAWLLPDGARVSDSPSTAPAATGPHYLRFLIGRRHRWSWLPARLTLAAIGMRSRSSRNPVAGANIRGGGAAGSDRRRASEPVGRGRMLVREVRAEVRQPAMVPAI